MPLMALALVMAAAAFHTWWNFIVKQVEEKQVFTWWALLVGALLYLPLLVTSVPIPGRIWPYAISSALVETAYFTALIRAYEHGDFSLVYPIARGAAPALLALWAMLFLGESPQPAGIAGLTVLLVGLVLVGGAHWWAQHHRATMSMKGVGVALGVALCISVYSAVDGAAVQVMAPAAYTVLVFGLTTVCITPVILAGYGCRPMIAVVRTHWIRILLVGIVMLLAYMLVLHAYAIARVSYVGALREVSIVLAALTGWLWLKENFGGVRTLGAALIFIGMLVIAIAG
jgi:drug/metabolite transporter (DMT)-like permease